MTRIRARCLVVFVWIVFVSLFFLIKAESGIAEIENKYHELVSGTYDFRFGKDRPFAPGNATTKDGKFIDPSQFVSSSRCASCHTDIHPQWEQSAHAKSFVEPFYQKNVRDLQDEKNIAFTRHCESCHNPIALFSGSLTDAPVVKDRPFDKEGVSCMVCHSIESVSGRGIGGYTIGQPALIEEEDGTKLLDVTDEDITNDIEGHRRAMMRDLLKKPEFCSSCHKSQVPKELNDYKFLRAFMVGDEFQKSSFSKETPHPFYTRDKESCNSCHMKRVETENYDVSVKDDKIVDHRFAAANTAIPMAYGYKRQFEAVVEFLKDDKVAIDIFALRRRSPNSTKSKLVAPINRETFRVKGGDELTAEVVITNKNIGHSFPPELRDFYEAFVEFSVEDDAGRTLYKSGFFDREGFLDPGAHNYKTYLLFEDGRLNDLHHIWRTKVVAHNNSIQSGRSDMARYRFVVPEGYDGTLTLRARLNYRRFTKVYSDYVIGSSTNLPVVTMAQTTETLNVGTKTREVRREAGDAEEWWRWNNYGIALLDNKQFPEAADAFDEVIDFKGAYRPTAYTNKALALIQLGGWKEASKLVDKSLKLEADNYRSIFQKGRIMKTFSRLDEAEQLYLKVLKQYPNDRDTLQQLGELAKLKSEAVPKDERKPQLERAGEFYKRILEIDPEDLSATYNLMLIFQKIGERRLAADMARQFRDLKADTTVEYLSANFLQENLEIGNESRPFHVHSLTPFSPEKEYSSYPTIAEIDWTKLLKTTADFPLK